MPRLAPRPARDPRRAMIPWAAHNAPAAGGAIVPTGTHAVVTTLVDDTDTLARTCSALAAAPRLAVDTEFIRERTYFAELALVQLGDGREIHLVDPVARMDMAPLVALLGNAGRTKVLHAARQDVEVMLPLLGGPVAPVLDTQVAAALLGFPAQIGYADLVARELDVQLAKGQARTDWIRRPLSPQQLEYAADDVRYLLPLADRLEERLAAKARLGWLAEECAALADPRLYRVDPADAWQRFKGIDQLKPAEQLRLRSLARWREERAQRRNLPRAWVLSDDAVREIARVPPRDVAQLQQLRVMPESAAGKLGAEILAALERAAGEPLAGVEQRTDGRPTPEEQARAKRLADRLRAVAAEVEVAPEVLATQKDVRKLVRGERDVPPLRGWRADVIGAPLLDALERE
jgi:ribonuclease D